MLCGQFGGHIDLIRANNADKLVKIVEQKLPVGNIYKIMQTYNEDEFILGSAEGLFFMCY